MDDNMFQDLVGVEATGQVVAYNIGEGDDITGQTAGTLGFNNNPAIRWNMIDSVSKLTMRTLDQSASFFSRTAADHARRVMLRLDKNIIDNNGSNAPKGITETTGVNAIANAAGTEVNYANLRNLITLVEDADGYADEGVFVLNPLIVGKANETPRYKDSGTAANMIVSNVDGTPRIDTYRIVKNNQLAKNVTKGSATVSSGFFGVLTDIALGYFSAMEAYLDASTDRKTGQLNFYLSQRYGFHINHAKNFTISKDLIQ